MTNFDNLTEKEKETLRTIATIAIWVWFFRLIRDFFATPRKRHAVWVFPDGRTVNANLREAP